MLAVTSERAGQGEAGQHERKKEEPEDTSIFSLGDWTHRFMKH